MYEFIRLCYVLFKVYIFRDVRESTLQILFESINNCGPIITKFAQWYVSILELENDINEIDTIKEIMSKTLEQCKTHNFEETEKMFIADFECDLSTTLEINEKPIASGSIGQVHHGYFGDYEVAVKVRHPDVDKNFMIYSLLIQCFAYFFLPTFETDTFISNIKNQLDFSLESSNLDRIHNIYKNDELIIVPKLYFFSKNFIVMSYEQGINFNQLQNGMHKYKAAFALICFQKQNSFIHGLHHGDLHKGNWKIRHEHDVQKLVVYDFGLMLKMNKDKLCAYDKYYQTLDINSLINEIMDSHSITLSESTKQDLSINLKTTIIKPPNSLDIIKEITKVLKRNKLKFNGNHLQILVSFGLTEHVMLHAKNKIFDEQTKYDNIYVNNCIDIISFCKTYNTCNDLKEFLESELKEVQINNVFEKQNDFMSMEEFYI